MIGRFKISFVTIFFASAKTKESKQKHNLQMHYKNVILYSKCIKDHLCKKHAYSLNVVVFICDLFSILVVSLIAVLDAYQGWNKASHH